LATKISFINEMANICEKLGANINEVRRGIGHDQRIGFAFLFPGVGYGGSCFPKDVRAMISMAEGNEISPRILHAVDDVNNAQKEVLFRKISTYFGNKLAGKTIAIWGLSFKPRTDDIREAPSLVLISQLLEAGAKVQAFDPVAMPNVKEVFGEKIQFNERQYDTLEGADALAIVTEWGDFRVPNFELMKQKLKQPVIFDGRNLYEPEQVRKLGFYYSGIGLHGDD